MEHFKERDKGTDTPNVEPSRVTSSAKEKYFHEALPVGSRTSGQKKWREVWKELWVQYLQLGKNKRVTLHFWIGK